MHFNVVPFYIFLYSSDYTKSIISVQTYIVQEIVILKEPSRTLSKYHLKALGKLIAEFVDKN